MDSELPQLVLIPDPKDERVWDNFRRIQEWATAITEQQSSINEFLLAGA